MLFQPLIVVFEADFIFGRYAMQYFIEIVD
jgi:hypothetical protein